jgi:hypothetical protein
MKAGVFPGKKDSNQGTENGDEACERNKAVSVPQNYLARNSFHALPLGLKYDPN